MNGAPGPADRRPRAVGPEADLPETVVNKCTRRLLKFSALALASCCLSAAHAQSSSVPSGPGTAAFQPAPTDNRSSEDSEDNVVVIGTRDTGETASDFVRQITVETDDQIAKFSDDICPASFGMPATYNEEIVGRVRQVAQATGIGVARVGCRPNVVIITADDTGEFIRRLHDERPEMFRGLELSDIRRVMRSDQPIRVWQMVETRGADGRPTQWIELVPGRTVRALTGVMPSLTQESTRQDLAVSFVVFDVDAIEGLTLTQISDYAAMRSFARTGTGRIPYRRSILTLFDDATPEGVPVDTLTTWDAAYLRALYATNNTVSGARQRSDMARMIERELGRSSEPADAIASWRRTPTQGQR